MHSLMMKTLCCLDRCFGTTDIEQRGQIQTHSSPHIFYGWGSCIRHLLYFLARRHIPGWVSPLAQGTGTRGMPMAATWEYCQLAWDHYLVPLAIIDSAGDHGAGVPTAQIITEVGESISQLNCSKIRMIDPSHVKQQAWFSFSSHF